MGQRRLTDATGASSLHDTKFRAFCWSTIFCPILDAWKVIPTFMETSLDVKLQVTGVYNYYFLAPIIRISAYPDRADLS